MVSIKVRGGTPEGCESLCRTCTRGHVISGFRTTDEEVYCRYFYIEREIRFPVRECTFYEDRRIASREDMEEIAWNLRGTDTKPKRDLGFVTNARSREISAGIAGTSDREEPEEVPAVVPMEAASQQE